MIVPGTMRQLSFASRLSSEVRPHASYMDKPTWLGPPLVGSSSPTSASRSFVCEAKDWLPPCSVDEGLKRACAVSAGITVELDVKEPGRLTANSAIHEFWGGMIMRWCTERRDDRINNFSLRETATLARFKPTRLFPWRASASSNTIRVQNFLFLFFRNHAYVPSSRLT
jgi:hypothetical protein